MLYYDVDHQELLRESLNDTLLSRYTIRNQNLSYTHAGKDISFKANWSRKIFTLSDLLNSEYTYTDIRPVSHTFNATIQTHLNTWLLRSEVGYAFSRSSDTLFITDFPSSDQNAMNNYFFDLLPPSFGDTIPYQLATDNFKTKVTLGNESLLFFLEYTNYSNRINESHINTSDNDLNGPRESACKLTYSLIKAQASWKLDDRSLIWTGVNYVFVPLNWEHTVFPDDPDTLEVVKIAHGKTHALNFQAGYHLLSFPFNFNATLAAGFINNITEASTPVLGYVLGFLPISHQADANFTNKSLLAHVHFDYPLKTGNSVFTPRFDLIAGRFWTDLSLLALLQFGLEDIDIQEQYIHAAYIASLGCKAQMALNSDLYLWFEADQLIPYIKQVSPVIPTPPPSDIKYYGGLSLKLGVSMTW